MNKPRLSQTERCLIERFLYERKTPYVIARELNRPLKTIIREIKNRTVVSEKGAAYRIKNRCIHSQDCTKTFVCERCYQTRQKRQCRLCSYCNKNCPDFVENICSKLSKPPYVCNGCKEEQKCVLRKKFYFASYAQNNYQKILVESRKGANITEEELLLLDREIYHFTQKGQSIHAAMVTSPEKFSVSEKTVYRYVNGGLLSTIRGELPRACSLKPRKTKSLEHKVDSKCRIGRTYFDYQEFTIQNPGIPVVEMDTVEGIKGGKVLLTLLFTPSRFMVAYLLDAKTAECVTTTFQKLRQCLTEQMGYDLGLETFAQLFPVILTDNGTEFSSPLRIEFDEEENRWTKVFYCEANSSYQKAFIERNHEFIRKILPKGSFYFEPTSFNDLTQEQINLMMSHINSYPREKLHNKTPYSLFTESFGEEIATNVFHIQSIPAKDIVLKPELLGIEQKVRPEILKP